MIGSPGLLNYVPHLGKWRILGIDAFDDEAELYCVAETDNEMLLVYNLWHHFVNKRRSGDS